MPSNFVSGGTGSHRKQRSDALWAVKFEGIKDFARQAHGWCTIHICIKYMKQNLTKIIPVIEKQFIIFL